MKTFLLCCGLLLLQNQSASDLIEKLRSDDVAVRNQAALALRKLGDAAFPALERAAEDKDKEVAGLARDLLKTMKAEDAVEKLRGRLESAESASILLKTSSSTFIGNAPHEDTGTITILMKRGNRAYYHARLFGLNAHIVMTLISDGTKVWLKWPEQAWAVYDVPPELNARLARIFVQTGCTHPAYVSPYVFWSAKDKSYVSPLKTSRLALSSTEPERIGVAFLLEDDTGSRDMTQWIDPATHGLLRSRSAAQNPKVRGTAESVVQRWELNREIPDQRFAPPAIGKTEEERIDLAKKTLRTLRDKLEAYSDDTGDYPTTAQGLAALVRKPTQDPVPKEWKGPYVEDASVLTDPWGNPYDYRFPGKRRPKNFDLGCRGPDGKSETDDDLR